jgi:hypothetical protein
MSRKNILGLSLISLIIIFPFPLFGETIILESEKGQQHEIRKLMSITPRDTLMGLNKQKLVYIHREEYDKPDHTISFIDEFGTVYHRFEVQDIILEADVFNGELYTLEAKCYPEYSIRKVKAISMEATPSPQKHEEQKNLPMWQRDVYKQHPRAWIEKMEIYIRKYNETNPQVDTLLNLGTITEAYSPYRTRLAGLIITKDQAKVIYYYRYTDMFNYDKSTDIEVCSYSLEGPGTCSSFKVRFEKEIPIYKYHDNNNLYLLDRTRMEDNDYLCKLIKIDIDTGDKQDIDNDLKIRAYGIDSYGNFIYLIKNGGSVQDLFQVITFSPESPNQYIDKIFIPSSFKFTEYGGRWDNQLEKFIIEVYKSSPGNDIYLLDTK